MKRKLYGFNSSQDVINLQTKYTLFPRVANIVFSLKVENGFDRKLMRQALELLVQRNDCLRIRILKKDGKMLQCFDEERKIGSVPECHFKWNAQQDAFLRRFRRARVKPEKGECLKTVFAVGPDGKDVIFFKVSHFVADTYAITILVNDLFAVYHALEKGEQLPPAPGSFEQVLVKDLEFKEDKAAIEKDRAFYRDYYEVQHPDHAIYCGLHGDGNDKWKKLRAKGAFSLPYLMVKCDTMGYRLSIPAAVTAVAVKWCEDNGITLSSFFFYTCALAASLVNGKQKAQTPLMLLDCRGTMAEKKCGGTKVQSLGVYTTVDYSLSFSENAQREFAAQNRMFRHTRLTYLEIEAMQHKQWGHSMLSQVTNFCWSFIPCRSLKDAQLQIHSNGKGALAAYIAAMYDVDSGRIDVMYDVQTMMISSSQLMDFHRLYLEVIEKVLAEPEIQLSELFK